MTDYAQRPDSAFVLPQIRKVPFNAPVRWLGEGWGDLRRVPVASLAYGVCFAVGGWLLAWVFADAYALFAGLLMGFLLLGPALAMGTYDLSRRLGQGEMPRFLDTVTAWRSNLANIGILAGVLGVLFLLWARASMVVFALFFDTAGLPTFADVLRAIFAFEQPTCHRPADDARSQGRRRQRRADEHGGVRAQPCGDAGMGDLYRFADRREFSSRLCRPGDGHALARPCLLACLSGPDGEVRRCRRDRN
jgi:hypothetical protein